MKFYLFHKLTQVAAKLYQIYIFCTIEAFVLLILNISRLLTTGKVCVVITCLIYLPYISHIYTRYIYIF